MHIVHVEEFSVDHLSTTATQNSADLDEIHKKAEEITSEIGHQTEDVNKFRPIRLVGNPAEEVINYSVEYDPEYIVVSGRKN